MIPDRVDISERPEIVELRARLGDWEGDTVFGQNAHLVTLVDRKSRLTLIKKVPNKEAETVANAMISLLTRVLGVKTVTLDNGGEFARHRVVSEAINADIYFAKPYASYQRGTNENTNGIIRRHWPKKNAHGSFNRSGYLRYGSRDKFDAEKSTRWLNPNRSLYRRICCTYCLNPAFI